MKNGPTTFGMQDDILQKRKEGLCQEKSFILQYQKSVAIDPGTSTTTFTTSSKKALLHVEMNLDIEKR